MRLKKVAAVVLTAAMTMATSAMAFGSTVTFHFQNSEGWDNVGAHIYEGVGFTTNVSPTDKLFVQGAKNDDGSIKPVWPGAKMEKEFGDWYVISADFTDVENAGLAVIFNNGVGDVEANDVGFSEEDAQAVIASGIPNVTNAEKKQTSNVTAGKKAVAKVGTLTDVYVTYEGGVATPSLNEAPQSYLDAKAAAEAAGASSDAGSTSSDNTAVAGDSTAAGTSAAGTAAGTTTSTVKGSTTSSSSVKTGDTVAVSVVAFGLLAAVAFVASKKKVNA